LLAPQDASQDLISVYDILSEAQNGMLMADKDQCRLLLFEMDFNQEQIDCLFEKEPGIKTIDDALNKLEFTMMGFNHSFVETANQEEGQCKICNGKKAEHRRAFLERL